MSFALTEEQTLIQRTVRELASTTFADRAKRADLESRFPRENVEALAQMGLLGITLDPEVGGAGADTVAYALACEEIAAACATTGAFTALTNAWIAGPLAGHGNDTLRSEWLPRVLSGEKLGTYGLFEDAVGGDPQRVRSTARPLSGDVANDGAAGPRDGASDDAPADPATEVGPARLSGTKDLTFLVGQADIALVVAKRGGGTGARRVDLYAVPTDRDGVAWGKDDSKLGLRGLPAGPLYMTRVPVGPEDLVGGPGQGVEIAREAYRLYSIGISACAVGLARAALEAAVVFANDRVQFGHPIAQYQAIQHYVAEIRTRADAARNIVLNAAAHHDRARRGESGGDLNLIEEANVLAFETARDMTRMSIRIHGGAGFMRDLPAERYARDARTLAALGRMPDVSKTLIGANVLAMGAKA